MGSSKRARCVVVLWRDLRILFVEGPEGLMREIQDIVDYKEFNSIDQLF
jgi:hypothetical protein